MNASLAAPVSLRKRRRWPWILLVVLLLAAAGAAWYFNLIPGLSRTSATSSTATSLPTVAIQSLDVATSAVSASGNLEFVAETSVPLVVGGIVRSVNVAVGDAVQAGQPLLTLDTTELERAYAQAQLNVESAKIALAELQTPATAAEVASAEATLKTAQQSLDDLLSGSGSAEVAAAQASLAAAQASYNELQAGPSDAELTQLSASLRKAEITLQEAQAAYDQVAWRGSGSSEAATLQSATIDYESAKAAFDESTAPASDSEVQSALSNISSAQNSLNNLLNSATQAEIASAQAAVDSAQAALDDLNAGPTENELRSQQISLDQALIGLEQARRNLDGATVLAPISGVVISINAEQGVRSSADSIAFMLADPTQLQLAISVAEADIPKVTVGQTATVEIDAMPGQTYSGVVAAIAPVNDSGSTSVSYPVTVRLTGDDLTGVLPGMNAVATLESQTTAAADSWLVPSNAVATQNGVSTVTVVRNNVPTQVQVTPNGVQGEWTIVIAPDLQAGDQVAGSLTSNLDSNVFGGPGGGGMIMGAGGPPSGGAPPSGGSRP